MRKITILCCLLSVAMISNAQFYQRLQNGINSDAFSAVCPAGNGGYLMAGYTNYNSRYPYSKARLLITKTDSAGNVVWSRIFSNSRHQQVTAIIPSKEGGFAATGFIQNIAGDSVSMFLMKLTNNGNLSWIKYYKNETYGIAALALAQTMDGGYALAGTKNVFYWTGDCYLVKTDSEGNLLWSKDFLALLGTPQVSAMEATADGGMIMAVNGRSPVSAHIDKDMYLLKINASGNLQWADYAGIAVKYKGTTYNDDKLYFLHATNDGGYIFGGATSRASLQQYSQPYIIKVDRNGNKIWSKIIPSDSLYREPRAVTEADNGDIFLVGAGNIKNSISYPYIIKLKKDGSFIKDGFLTAPNQPSALYAVSAPYQGKITAVGRYGAYSTNTTDIDQAIYVNFDTKLKGCGTAIAADSQSLDTGFVKKIVITMNNAVTIVQRGTDTLVANTLVLSGICATGNAGAAGILSNLQIESKTTVSVVPTIASSAIMVKISAATAGKGIIKICSQQGVFIRQYQMDLVNGINEQKADITALPPGIYYVTLALNGNMVKDTFIKQ